MSVSGAAWPSWLQFMEMHTRRFLKYINIIIGLVLIVLLAALWWLLWRPMARTSGEIAAPVEGELTVSRDARGTTHIEASSLDDALFAQGFVTAQERMFQMDFLRRAGAGELAAILGPQALEGDLDARRQRLRRIAEQHRAALPPAAYRALAAYARGVNHYLDTHRHRLPAGFVLLRYDPMPWTITDSILAGLLMYRQLTNSWRFELQKEGMLAGGDPAKVNFLFSPRHLGEVLPGSNAWAISGAHTRSGKPLLANDPHLGHSLPPVWYLNRLTAPGLDVTGASLPGLPGVVIGHNGHIAWGVTNLQFDVQDLYVEEFDPASGRYRFGNRLEQAIRETDFIEVKGEKTVHDTHWLTRHGPVISATGGRHLALRWTAAEMGRFDLAVLDLNRARDWSQFRAALRQWWGAPLNFVYADVDGNIGYQVAGLLPVRRRHAGDVPADGASGLHEWDGFIPFEDLPSRYNPPSGLLVTANQNPFPENYPYTVSGNFSSPHRARQIVALLSASQNWDAESLLSVQMDVYGGPEHRLAKHAAAAYAARGIRDATLEQAAGILSAWNGQMERGPAPFLAVLLYQHTRKAMAAAASPGKGADYGFTTAASALERLLAERPAGWFEDYDSMLLTALSDAIEEGRRIQGREMAKWDYARYNVLTMNPPVLGDLPLLGRYFRIGPLPLSGSGNTVKQTTSRIGASLRFVADTAAWDNSLASLPFGQSGHALSRHYRDQLEAHRYGRAYPLLWTGTEIKSRLKLVPAAR